MRARVGAFEADLHSALVEQCTDMRTELTGRYIEGTGVMFQRLQEDLEKALTPRLIAPTQDFVPGHAADGPEPPP